MKKVDQFFNKKFQDREFEFKDAYWADAQKLIEADKKRRRRGGLWFWFFGIAVLSMVSLGLYGYFGGEQSFMDGENQSALNIKVDEKSTVKTEQSFEENSKENKNALANNTGSESEKNHSTTLETKVSNTNSSKLKTNNPANRNTAISNSTSDFNNKNFKKKSGMVNAVENISTRTNSSTIPNLSLIPSGESDQEKETLTSPKNDSNTEAIIDANRVLLSSVDLLEFKGISSLVEESEWTIDCSYCYVKENPKWAFAWNLYSLFNTQKGSEYLWLGAATGPSAQYRLNKRLAIQTDVLYRWRRGHFGAGEESIQRTYGFGFQEETFRLTPVSIHQLDWPIYLQLRNRRQSLEAGISLQFNVGTMGNLTSEKSLFPWQRNGIATTEFSTVKQAAWIKDPNIRTIQMGLLLGYRYQVSKKISAVLQARYELNSIYKTPPIDGSGELDGNPLHFKIGVTYFPFK